MPVKYCFSYNKKQEIKGGFMREIFAVWDKDNNTISVEYSIDDIILKGSEFPKNRAFLASFGVYGDENKPEYLRDNNQVLIKEFDVLILDITEDLMNTTFSNSNIGKELAEHPEVKHVILALGEREQFWELFYADQDGLIGQWENGEPKHEATGSGTLFPTYLVNKGACVQANLKTQPDFITSRLRPLESEKEL